jgi:branched-subunit amino acid transport protein
VNASNAPLVWAVVLTAGLLTYALRASFIFAYDRIGGLPDDFERGLEFVPAAVLAGLVLPSLLLRDGGLAVSAGNTKLVSGVVAFGTAWVTENTLATIAAGMAVFWTLRFLV